MQPKSFLLSKTLWGIVLAIAPQLIELGASGVLGPKWQAAISGLGALLAIYGRVMAKQPLSIVPAAPCLLPFVALCLLSAAHCAHAASFTLTWADNSSNEDGFVVERAPGLNATTGFVAIGLVGRDVKTFVDPGLPASVPLSYRIFAYNVAGRSGYSNTASGTSSTIPAGVVPPTAPSGGTIQGDAPYTPPVIAMTLNARVQGDKVLALSLTAQPEAAAAN